MKWIELWAMLQVIGMGLGLVLGIIVVIGYSVLYILQKKGLLSKEETEQLKKDLK